MNKLVLWWPVACKTRKVCVDFNNQREWFIVGAGMGGATGGGDGSGQFMSLA